MWSQEKAAMEKNVRKFNVSELKVNELGAGHMQRNVSCLQKPKGRKKNSPPELPGESRHFFFGPSRSMSDT